jgi:hypothetical protein
MNQDSFKAGSINKVQKSIITTYCTTLFMDTLTTLFFFFQQKKKKDCEWNNSNSSRKLTLATKESSSALCYKTKTYMNVTSNLFQPVKLQIIDLRIACEWNSNSQSQQRRQNNNDGLFSLSIFFFFLIITSIGININIILQR